MALTSSVDARIIRPQSELDFGVRVKECGGRARGDVRGHDITFFRDWRERGARTSRSCAGMTILRSPGCGYFFGINDIYGANDNAVIVGDAV